jgi:chromosome segregation ATPase
MVTEALEIRMARLEGAYEQINERLAGVERELSAFRAEFKAELNAEIGGVRSEIGGVRSEIGGVRSEIGGLRSEIRSEIAALRSDNADLRKQLQTQFYWTLTLILGAVLFPVLRDLALTR